MTYSPKALIEAVRFFADEQMCQEYMLRLKWPDGKVTCPECGGESTSPVKNRPLIQCNNRECKKQFSYKVGTIFEASKLPLGHWFVAVWSVANCKNGISSHELARALGWALAELGGETSGQMNPRFLEWMMGFPPGWTELEC